MKALEIKTILLAGLATLAGCSASDEINDEPNNNSEENTEVPVNFSSYFGQSANTRAGVTGDLTTTQLESDGFGVFAYYTGTNTYQEERTSITPNFMYNTKVSGSNWTYSPVRYWPNDNEDESGNATSQYVSFFTYAPYVSSITEGDTIGITSLPENTTIGDPVIGYSTNPDKNGNSVDLLWGTTSTNGNQAKANSGSNGNVGKAYTANSESTDSKAIKVDADLTKMTISGKVGFNFKHALAKFGGYSSNNKSGVTVNLIADDGQAFDSTTTRVTIKYINIKAQNLADGTASTLKRNGKFNLVTGSWDTSSSTSTTDYIQTINSSNSGNTTTGTVSDTLATSIAEPASTTALVSGDNWSDDMPKGVTTTAKNIYSENSKPIYIIPGQTPRFVITICYVVRTLDPTLAKKYTEVTQTITRNVDFSDEMRLNKQYSLAIHLGLTSVKFDATVDNWSSDSTTDGSSSASIEVNMPENVK